MLNQQAREVLRCFTVLKDPSVMLRIPYNMPMIRELPCYNYTFDDVNRIGVAILTSAIAPCGAIPPSPHVSAVYNSATLCTTQHSLGIPCTTQQSLGIASFVALDDAIQSCM
jgi:hypothetical protein